MRNHLLSFAADLFIALAGPATHIPQFLVWFACLFPAYHAAYGSWSMSLAIPPPQQHFGLAVVAGACQVRQRRPPFGWQLLRPMHGRQQLFVLVQVSDI